MTETPLVSVITVSYNTCADTLALIESLDHHVSLPIEIIVVDNASSDGTPQEVQLRFPRCRSIVLPANVGFSRANNRGLAVALSPHVLLINSDAVVTAGALERMVALLDRRADVAIVAPRTREGDGTIQLSFGDDPSPWTERRQRRLMLGLRARDAATMRQIEARAAVEHEPDWVSGACFLARRETLLRVGGFDESFFLYQEDADLCRRVRATGQRILFTPDAEIIHHSGRSGAAISHLVRMEYHRSHILYYRKHNGSLATLLIRCRVFLAGLTDWKRAWRASATPAERLARRRQALEICRLAWSSRPSPLLSRLAGDI
ncbi:MAG: glycosyltransferase family 2 protein [Vicinamibacteria bacterium]|nr:glycosyltransferase family 2 protein [Vicinamibacteria bacterium]